MWTSHIWIVHVIKGKNTNKQLIKNISVVLIPQFQFHWLKKSV